MAWPISTCIGLDKSGYQLIFVLFLHKNVCCGYSLEVPPEALLMRTNNIYFHGKIRKISILFGLKKASIKSYAKGKFFSEDGSNTIFTVNICTNRPEYRVQTRIRCYRTWQLIRVTLLVTHQQFVDILTGSKLDSFKCWDRSAKLLVRWVS